ncbi:MAG: prephenate dehydratase [Desulfitobacteriaceae bacterium]|nr:prephenate dehydratase [Desulfitobacteriaceae bacterium]MDD4345715.1 prephenate dehydratase [Desulfitobacteriaceae bacterium]MDD4400427.1 prephenate dehydratase [Desulfitobacteriaceae bacterium]
MRVGYLGPRGTFSEEATARCFRKQDVELVAFPTIIDVLEEVQSGTIDKAVVPIENTFEGSITMSVDSLAASPDLFVQGEIIMAISQHLLGLEQANFAGIKEVWSVPPALAQCRQFIRRNNLVTKNFDSTVSAALEVKKQGRIDVGAIASEWAAKQAGMKIIKSNIQDSAENHTRFVIVTKGQQLLAEPQKTMLLIIPSQEQIGVLSNIAHVFAALNLNLSWIESRPTKTKLGTYQFYLDVEVGMEDVRMTKALAILQILDNNVRILGSYITIKDPD